MHQPKRLFQSEAQVLSSSPLSFQHGVLMPRMARSLINLTKVRAGEMLLDPFAGTCGILIEACLIGIEGTEMEVQTRLVKGASCNLQGMDCGLICGDAKRLPFRDGSIDAAVLDTPHGRSARIEAASKAKIVESIIWSSIPFPQWIII